MKSSADLLCFLPEPAFLVDTIVTLSAEADIHTSLCYVNLYNHMTWK